MSRVSSSQRFVIVESLIDSVVDGSTPFNVLHSYIAAPGHFVLTEDDTISVGVKYDSRGSLRTFFDGYGRLRFCTENDVLINPDSDHRLQELMQYADALDVDNPLFDLFESYEGSLDVLYKQVTDAFSLIPEIGT